MQGINMDTSQSSAWPVLAGLSTNAPMANFAAPVYPSAGGGAAGASRDGGRGQQQQQSPNADAVSPNTIPGMAGMYQSLGVDGKPVR